MRLIGCGKGHDARTPGLSKNAVGVGFRFQGACQGLGSAVQALVFDKVRLRPCLNVRPDTVVVTPYLWSLVQKIDRSDLQGIEVAVVIDAPTAGLSRKLTPLLFTFGGLARCARLYGRIIPWRGFVITAALIRQPC